MASRSNYDTAHVTFRDDELLALITTQFPEYGQNPDLPEIHLGQWAITSVDRKNDQRRTIIRVARSRDRLEEELGRKRNG